MSYYFNAVLKGVSFEEAIDKVTEELKKEGFGIISEIDVKDTLKKKIGVNFRKYTILGACNPHFAHNAILNEPKIGVFLPCNFIIDEIEEGVVDVSSVDPIASMSSVENDDLRCIANDIHKKLKAVIDNLK